MARSATVSKRSGRGVPSKPGWVGVTTYVLGEGGGDAGDRAWARAAVEYQDAGAFGVLAELLDGDGESAGEGDGAGGGGGRGGHGEESLSLVLAC